MASTVHLLMAVLSLQAADSSTYADPAAEALLERARMARGSEAAGLRSYEATVRERIHLGLSGFRFRRLRSLYRSERVARVRWDRDQGETLHWIGIRKEVPVAGAAAEIDIEEDEDLDAFPIDPTGNRLILAGSRFLHPLADTAAAHYRYASGDTMRVLLSTGRAITLVEVRLEPRRSDFSLLAGSLWFDLETAALVRAAYRPARPFNMEVDDPKGGDNVPGFLQPIVVDVDFITIDYALRELQWWLPHRIRMEGYGKAGSVLRLPVTIEMFADDFDVNSSSSAGLDRSAEPLPGWDRYEVESEDDGDGPTRIVFRPPDSVLVRSPVLSDTPADPSPIAFSASDLNRLRGRLADLAVPGAPPRPATLRPVLPRYNRVEALSLGAEWSLPLSAETRLRLRGRIGAGDMVPGAELQLERARATSTLTVAGYHRLTAVDDWGDPLSLGNSLNALTLGYDDGQYYRASGAAVGLRGESGSLRFSGQVYAERHRTVLRETDVSLANAFGSDGFGPNIDADELDLFGLKGRIRTQIGLDPERLVAALDSWGEVGLGDASFQRVAATVSLASPLGAALGAAVQIGSGVTFSEAPAQRLFYLGGPTSIRGFRGGQIFGEAFWLARIELATRRPAVRLLAFSDFAWAGDSSDFGTTNTAGSVGAGISALDGLVRVDLARGFMGPEPLRWRLHAYLDALF
ncbi:MAG: BamA/TamA family outer membrane protein [Gemmatimonadota bacterium]